MPNNNLINNSGNGWVWISTTNMSAASGITISSLSPDYTIYALVLRGITVSSSGVNLVFSENTASAWAYTVGQIGSSGGTPQITSINTTGASNSIIAPSIANTAGYTLSGTIYVAGAAKAVVLETICRFSYQDSTLSGSCVTSGGYGTGSTGSTSITIAPSAGTISGKVTLYGII